MPTTVISQMIPLIQAIKREVYRVLLVWEIPMYGVKMAIVTSSVFFMGHCDYRAYIIKS